jgi:hypothetical protein
MPRDFDLNSNGLVRGCNQGSLGNKSCAVFIMRSFYDGLSKHCSVSVPEYCPVNATRSSKVCLGASEGTPNDCLVNFLVVDSCLVGRLGPRGHGPAEAERPLSGQVRGRPSTITSILVVDCLVLDNLRVD